MCVWYFFPSPLFLVLSDVCKDRKKNKKSWIFRGEAPAF